MLIFNTIILSILQVVSIYYYVVIVNAIGSMLIAFGIVNYRNQLVSIVMRFTDALVSPVTRLINKVIPTRIEQVDLSPILIILILNVVQSILLTLVV